VRFHWAVFFVFFVQPLCLCIQLSQPSQIERNMKIVIIGAGSVSFTQGLIADMILTGGEWDIHLVDVNPENLGVAHGVVQRIVDHTGAVVRLTPTMERREALPGADAVVCTFGVGGRRAWEQDVFVPRRYGIYQPVGDSVLPGGISRAMRHVPLAVAIAQDILELCPDARFINYANPMTAITRAIRKATGAEVIGLCHGVNHTQSYLAEIAGLPLDETAISVIGVNHCTWITEFRHQGRSIWPLLHDRLSGAEAQSRLGEAASSADAPFSEYAPLSWELFKLYGAFPAPLDRHVAEFFPALCREGAYYGRTPGVNAFSFEGTIESGDREFASMARIASGEAPLNTEILDHAPGEHEQLVTILQALRGEGSGLFSVNLPNAGRVPGVAAEAILEGMALIDENGVRTLSVGAIPLGLRDQMARRAAVTELTVDAALSGDLDLMAQAILVEGSLSRPDEARALARDLVAAQAAHLPQFSRSNE
jgi:alpha-galactosidase